MYLDPVLCRLLYAVMMIMIMMNVCIILFIWNIGLTKYGMKFKKGVLSVWYHNLNEILKIPFRFSSGDSLISSHLNRCVSYLTFS